MTTRRVAFDLSSAVLAVPGEDQVYKMANVNLEKHILAAVLESLDDKTITLFTRGHTGIQKAPNRGPLEPRVTTGSLPSRAKGVTPASPS